MKNLTLDYKKLEEFIEFAEKNEIDQETAVMIVADIIKGKKIPYHTYIQKKTSL